MDRSSELVVLVKLINSQLSYSYAVEVEALDVLLRGNCTRYSYHFLFEVAKEQGECLGLECVNGVLSVRSFKIFGG